MTSLPNLYYSNWDLRTRSLGITWNIVKEADSTYKKDPCVLKFSLWVVKEKVLCVM
jgi:hypothetical protein